MCNLYVMYYTEYRNVLAGQSPPCIGVQFHDLVESLPIGNDIPLPKNLEMEQQAAGNHHHHHPAPLSYKGLTEDRNSPLQLDGSPTNGFAGLGGKSNALLNNEYSK